MAGCIFPEKSKNRGFFSAFFIKSEDFFPRFEKLRRHHPSVAFWDELLNPKKADPKEVAFPLQRRQSLPYHHLARDFLAFVLGFQEIHAFRALAKVEGGEALMTVFVDLAARDVVDFNVPLAFAEVEVESAV